MSASPRIARAWVSLLWRADVRRVLPFVTTKTLVLHREADHFCSPSAGEAFSELGGDVERLVLPGRDHFPGAGAEDVALRVAQFVRECAGAAPEAPGSLATWLLTDIRSSLLPARLSAKLLQEGTPALYRLDRPGAALRWLRELFQRHPGQGKAALACSKRADDPAQILSELEPLWASARPGEVNATDLAWALIEGTSAFVRARDSMISAAGPIEGDRSSGQTLAEVGPLLHKSFSVCVDGPLRLRIEGVIMLKDPDRQLIPHFRRIHECVVGCGTFELDVRKLSQINSSGIGMFIRWVGWIQAEPPGRRYRLAIHADPSNLWQRGNLMPLSMIAPDVIEIVQGKGR